MICSAICFNDAEMHPPRNCSDITDAKLQTDSIQNWPRITNQITLVNERSDAIRPKILHICSYWTRQTRRQHQNHRKIKIGEDDTIAIIPDLMWNHRCQTQS